MNGLNLEHEFKQKGLREDWIELIVELNDQGIDGHEALEMVKYARNGKYLYFNYCDHEFIEKGETYSDCRKCGQRKHFHNISID